MNRMNRKYTAAEMRETASLSFLPDKVTYMLRQAAEIMEEKERERVFGKRYMYFERYPGGWICNHAFYDTLEEARAMKLPRNTIVRRSVGEWEDVE